MNEAVCIKYGDVLYTELDYGKYKIGDSIVESDSIDCEFYLKNDQLFKINESEKIIHYTNKNTNELITPEEYDQCINESKDDIPTINKFTDTFVPVKGNIETYDEVKLIIVDHETMNNIYIKRVSKSLYQYYFVKHIISMIQHRFIEEGYNLINYHTEKPYHPEKPNHLFIGKSLKTSFFISKENEKIGILEAFPELNNSQYMFPEIYGTYTAKEYISCYNDVINKMKNSLNLYFDNSYFKESINISYKYLISSLEKISNNMNVTDVKLKAKSLHNTNKQNLDDLINTLYNEIKHEPSSN